MALKLVSGALLATNIPADDPLIFAAGEEKLLACIPCQRANWSCMALENCDLMDPNSLLFRRRIASGQVRLWIQLEHRDLT